MLPRLTVMMPKACFCAVFGRGFGVDGGGDLCPVSGVDGQEDASSAVVKDAPDVGPRSALALTAVLAMRIAMAPSARLSLWRQVRAPPSRDRTIVDHRLPSSRHTLMFSCAHSHQQQLLSVSNWHSSSIHIMVCYLGLDLGHTPQLARVQVHASGLLPLMGARLSRLCLTRGWDAPGEAGQDDLNVVCHIVTFHVTAAPGAS